MWNLRCWSAAGPTWPSGCQQSPRWWRPSPSPACSGPCRSSADRRGKKRRQTCRQIGFFLPKPVTLASQRYFTQFSDGSQSNCSQFEAINWTENTSNITKKDGAICSRHSRCSCGSSAPSHGCTPACRGPQRSWRGSSWPPPGRSPVKKHRKDRKGKDD